MVLVPEFDEVNRIWSSPNQNVGFNIDQLVGPAILDRLKVLDQSKVLEIYHSDGKETTVAEMRRLAITCAKNLEKLGVKKGDIVVMFSQINALTTATCYGCFIVGAIVNPMVVSMDDDDTDHVLSYINPTVIIYDEIYKEKLQASLDRVQGSNLRFLLSTDSSNTHSQEQILFKTIPNLDLDNFIPPNLGDPKKVVLSLSLTSGSSGRPKSIQLSHSFYLNAISKWWEPFAGMRLYIASPFGWISHLSNISHPVFLDQVRICSGKESTPDYAVKLINDTKATHLFCATEKLTDIIEYCRFSGSSHYLKSLKQILFGGSPVTDTLRKDTLETVPGCDLGACYGMTEFASMISCDDGLKGNLGMALKNGFQLKIVDNSFNTLGVNQKGKILLKPCVEFLGYYKNDKANQECFIADGWFATGDYGYMNEHNLLHILGRYNDLFAFDGELIIPSQIQAIANSFPAVLRAAVISTPHKDPSRGKLAVIFVVLRTKYKVPGNDASKIKLELEEYLKQSLKWEQIHSFSVVDEFKYLANGKLDKKAMQANFVESV